MISTFRERTDVTSSLARELLEAAGWNFDIAMRLYRKGPEHLMGHFYQQKRKDVGDVSSGESDDNGVDQGQNDTSSGITFGKTGNLLYNAKSGDLFQIIPLRLNKPSTTLNCL